MNEKELAKSGIVTTLGALLISGFCRFKYARMLHPLAGVALIGFSLWHHILSKPQSR
jgi:hypothetical protein